MTANDGTSTRRVRRTILASVPRDALYERARVLRIRGRSRMTKDELADAVLERVDGGEELAEVLRRLTPAR